MTRAYVEGLVALALSSLAGGCAHYVPAQFADKPPVLVVKDDQPIPVPGRASFDERVQIADVYLRRPLFDQVHPLEFPTGGDVNSLDDVPASSWFDPTNHGELPPGAAPPQAPFTVLNENAGTTREALAVNDANGVRYELVTDPLDHPGLYTTADVLTGYLLRGLGLRAPPSFIVTVSDSALVTPDDATSTRLSAWLADKEPSRSGLRRVSATLWPTGKDVGISGDYTVRGDDPNDTVPHNDRRTLRALKVFAQWLGFADFGVNQTRDVYVGDPDQGHLLHYVVGESRALGTRALRDHLTRDEQSGSMWFKLVTLGLSPPVTHLAQRSPYPGLGYLPAHLGSDEYSVSPPYSPFVRLTPPDAYWAAKRLANPAMRSALRAGIAASRVPQIVASTLVTSLVARRQTLVGRGLAQVTPLEAESATPKGVVVRDVAVALGFQSAGHTRYEVEYLASEGADVAPRLTVDATGMRTVLPLPREVTGLVVLHVVSKRDRKRAPRACDIHVIVSADAARIIGVRH